MSVHAVISPLIVGYNFLLPSTFQSYLCICKRVLECLLHVFSVKYDGFNLRFQFVQKIAEYEISEFVKTQLTLPDEIDPADEMSWQHYLYSKLGSKKGTGEIKPQQLDEVVDRIIAMAKVLFGLHMVSKLFF